MTLKVHVHGLSLLVARVAIFAVLLPAALAGTLLTGVARGVAPADQVFPSSTKGFLSLPDSEHFSEEWQKTQLGQLVNDPMMKPFVEDLQRQIREKLLDTEARLGLKWSDVQDVAAGEIGIATIKPASSAHAMGVSVDVTGKLAKAADLLTKIGKELKGRGVVADPLKMGDVSVSHYRWKTKDGLARQTFLCIDDSMLLVSSDRESLAGMLRRARDAANKDSLGKLPAYQAVMNRCKSGNESDGKVQTRWFIEPFGYAKATRAAVGGRRQRGKDMLKILENQGFAAVQGIGGALWFNAAGIEMLSRTFVYAPGEEGKRFKLAARMLEFPNSPAITVQNWVPENVTSLLSFNWRMKDAFEHSKSIVNELLNNEPGNDLFEDVLDGIANDVMGPMVDLRKELIAHFDERAMLFTDHTLPIKPDSERWLFAIKVKNTQAVKATIKKLMEAEPDAQSREVSGHTIWEIVDSQEEVSLETIQIGGLQPLVPEEAEDDPEKKLISNLSVTVSTDGHLLVSSRATLLEEVVKRMDQASALEKASDFAAVNKALGELVGKSQSFRFFSRTEKAYRPTYEMLRTGKMPESQSLLGKVLNRMLGPDEDGVVRQQQIDGSKLPPFEKIQHYLGPSGLSVVSETDGWFLSSCLLKR